MAEGSDETLEIEALAYNLLYLLSNPEYSVRDYALYTVQKILPKFPERIFRYAEEWLVKQITQSKEELISRSILNTLRSFVRQAKIAGDTSSLSSKLIPLLNSDPNSEDDFFG